jgi:hypothetical protein
MTFRVGQKVVCVDDDFFRPYLAEPLNLPIKGQVYTIRGSISDERWTWYWLVEIVNPPSSLDLLEFGKVEPAFKPSHFRPAVETDISIFTAMLDRPKVSA